MAGFIVLSLTTAAVYFIEWSVDSDVIIDLIFTILFDVVVPVAVLVINMIVLCEIRRASKHSAANLGLQQHQQSTSSNSAVPTVMLVTTSFVYSFLCGTYSTVFVVRHMSGSLYSVFLVSGALVNLVYAYNFYVYLITGKQFRSELYKLFCYCPTFSSAADAAAAGYDNNDARIARRVHNDTAV